MAFGDAGALLAEPMLAVVEGLGAALVRAKGFVHIAGETRRGFLERAGTRTSLSFGEPWATISRGPIRADRRGARRRGAQRQLWACRAADSQ